MKSLNYPSNDTDFVRRFRLIFVDLVMRGGKCMHASHVLKVADIVRNQIYLEASPIMCHKQYLRFGPHENEVIPNFAHGACGYAFFLVSNHSDNKR